MNCHYLFVYASVGWLLYLYGKWKCTALVVNVTLNGKIEWADTITDITDQELGCQKIPGIPFPISELKPEVRRVTVIPPPPPVSVSLPSTTPSLSLSSFLSPSLALYHNL